MRITILCLLLLPLLAGAQKGPFALSNNIKLERVFAGFLSKTYVLVDTPAMVKNVSEMRVALMLTDSLGDKCSFRIFGALTLGKHSYSNSSAEFILKPAKKVKINVGYTATLTTDLRPNPTTSESLIESAAQASIIGARPTIKVQYKWTDFFATSLGYSYHDSIGALHAGLSFKGVRLHGYITQNEYLLSSDGKLKLFEYTLTYRNSGIISSAIFLKLKRGIVPFIDMQFPKSQNSVEMVGIRKYFAGKSNEVKGFLAAGYDINTKILAAQLYLHI